jgi:hypothetical protein
MIDIEWTIERRLRHGNDDGIDYCGHVRSIDERLLRYDEVVSRVELSRALPMPLSAMPAT